MSPKTAPKQIPMRTTVNNVVFIIHPAPEALRSFDKTSPQICVGRYFLLFAFKEHFHQNQTDIPCIFCIYKSS